MPRIRRGHFPLIALCIMGLLGGRPLWAATGFPQKSLRMIIGFPAGSSSDVIGRLVAQKMSDSLGQSVVFENRPGAGANIAADYVAKSSPDGYISLYANTGIAVAYTAYDKLSYDALRDLTPVGQSVEGPHLLVVNITLPIHSVKDLITLAKSKSGALNMASSGNGNSDHFAYELFRSMTGAQMQHIPYKGGGQALVDVINGQIAAYFSGMAAGLPHVRNAKVRGLAVTTAKRSSIAPDIMTMDEAGVTGYEHVLWNAVFVPAATPQEVINRLDRDMAKAVSAVDLKERFSALGVETNSRNAAQMLNYFKSEIEKYGKIVRAIGLKIE